MNQNAKEVIRGMLYGFATIAVVIVILLIIGY